MNKLENFEKMWNLRTLHPPFWVGYVEFWKSDIEISISDPKNPQIPYIEQISFKFWKKFETLEICDRIRN